MMEQSGILFLRDLTIGVFDLNTLETTFVAHVESDSLIFTEHIVAPFDFYLHGASDDQEHFLIIPDSEIKSNPNWAKQVYFHDQLIDCPSGTEKLYIFSFKSGPSNSIIAMSLNDLEKEQLRSAISVE